MADYYLWHVLHVEQSNQFLDLCIAVASPIEPALVRHPVGSGVNSQAFLRNLFVEGAPLEEAEMVDDEEEKEFWLWEETEFQDRSTQRTEARGMEEASAAPQESVVIVMAQREQLQAERSPTVHEIQQSVFESLEVYWQHPHDIRSGREDVQEFVAAFCLLKERSSIFLVLLQRLRTLVILTVVTEFHSNQSRNFV